MKYKREFFSKMNIPTKIYKNIQKHNPSFFSLYFWFLPCYILLMSNQAYRNIPKIQPTMSEYHYNSNDMFPTYPYYSCHQVYVESYSHWHISSLVIYIDLLNQVMMIIDLMRHGIMLSYHVSSLVLLLVGLLICFSCECVCRKQNEKSSNEFGIIHCYIIIVIQQNEICKLLHN